MTESSTIAAMAIGCVEAPAEPTSRSAYCANVMATAAIAPVSIRNSSAQPYRNPTSGCHASRR